MSGKSNKTTSKERGAMSGAVDRLQKLNDSLSELWNKFSGMEQTVKALVLADTNRKGAQDGSNLDPWGKFLILAQILNFLVAIVAAIYLLWTDNTRPHSRLLAEVLSFSIVTTLLLFVGYVVVRLTKARRSKHMAIASVVVGMIVLSSVPWYRDYQRKQHSAAILRFEQKLASHTWLAYEPVEIDPVDRKFAREEDIERDLQTLTRYGFDGLITFSSDFTNGYIPQRARKVGFQGVIMGIFNVESREEIEAAVSSSTDVDAYCIGHNWDHSVGLQPTGKPFSPDDVLRCIEEIKARTGKPVSTTLSPTRYDAFPKIVEAIDYLFPDIHGSWYDSANADFVMQETKDLVNTIADLRIRYPDKPVLLKMVCFPSCGVNGATEESQLKFYEEAERYFRLSGRLPGRVYPSYFSAFDIAWKRTDRGWPPGETCLGFFNRDGTPKLAVNVFKPGSAASEQNSSNVGKRRTEPGHNRKAAPATK